MLLVTRYIDDKGEIVPLLYKITHNIVDDTQKQVLKEIIEKFNNNILIIRGISDYSYIKTDLSLLKTDKYVFDIKSSGFKYYQLPEPAMGGATECITQNINLITQIECRKVQSYFENIRIQLMNPSVNPDNHIVMFNEIRSNGIIPHTYNIKFVFSSDWSATCITCSNGMAHVRLELDKMCKYMYATENNNYSLDGFVITDLEVANIDLLKEKMMLLLANAFSEAKIVDILLDTINPLGVTGDET